MRRLTEEQLQALEAEGFTRNRGIVPTGVDQDTCITVIYFDGQRNTDTNYADSLYWTIDGYENDPFSMDIAAFRIEKPETCKKTSEASLVDQLADALQGLYLRPSDAAAIKRAELALEAYNSR